MKKSIAKRKKIIYNEIQETEEKKEENTDET